MAFRGPEIGDGDLYAELVKAMYAVHRAIFRFPGTCWVMDLDWYRRIRATAVTEEQETGRALAHARAVVPVSATFPRGCPACPAGPFTAMDDLAAHASAMADPFNREPSDDDCLFGVPVKVREDGGRPHIENPAWLEP